jgi:integral membrane sensor domain MASE1
MDGNRKRYLAKIAALAAVYYGAAKLGLHLAFETPSVTAVWPPTGIALASLVLWGYRLWPGVALGALLANAWTGVPAYVVLGITVGNTLEALAGAYLLERLANFRPSLERVIDVLALVLFAGGLSTMVSATIGVSSLVLGDEVALGDFGSVWRTWWLGDMGGDLLVAPAIMVAVTHWPYGRAPGRRLEAVALLATIAGVTSLAFATGTGLTYLVFPVLIWATLRFWQPGAAAASLLAAAIAVVFTNNDLGPYAGQSPDERLLLAQTFVGVAGLTSLILAAVVSERRLAEDTAERIADTLQESLLPAHLPDIPGIEHAVDFRPAGERHIVGGDFYDWFQNEDGSWSVVVGDVRGKGADAARTTALARYTLRAAAGYEHRPSRVLELLNEAIRRQAPDQSCTVAYARLDLGDGGRVRVTVAIGGHPLPLVLGPAGAVDPVGSPGTLLGVVPDPKLSDHTTDLAPGATLVMYTDGLTDAFAPARIVTQAQLVTSLRACAGRSAPGIVEGIQKTLLGGNSGEPRDDIVVVALRVPEREGVITPPSRG